jgi:hypothetical protein
LNGFVTVIGMDSYPISPDPGLGNETLAPSAWLGRRGSGFYPQITQSDLGFWPVRYDPRCTQCGEERLTIVLGLGNIEERAHTDAGKEEHHLDLTLNQPSGKFE